MQENRFEKTSATHGTPMRFVRPMKRGALPFLAMNSKVREATYNEPFPADTTLSTIKALIRCAAGRIPASVREIVNGELAVLADEPRSLGSVYGIRMPMKNIVPAHQLGSPWFKGTLTDVENEDPPEYLPDRSWDSFPRIRGLARGDPNPAGRLSAH